MYVVVCVNEQRKARRSEVHWPVSVWHPTAARFFNGSSVNISSGGALVELPMKAPIREGQDIEVNFPRKETLTKEKGSSARIKTARVVRVDRGNTIQSANIKVALNFCTNEELAQAL